MLAALSTIWQPHPPLDGALEGRLWCRTMMCIFVIITTTILVACAKFARLFLCISIKSCSKPHHSLSLRQISHFSFLHRCSNMDRVIFWKKKNSSTSRTWGSPSKCHATLIPLYKNSDQLVVGFDLSLPAEHRLRASGGCGWNWKKRGHFFDLLVSAEERYQWLAKCWN